MATRDGRDGGLRRGLDTGAEWLWLLDTSALPQPRALGALLDALGRTVGLPAPAILAGIVVRHDGRVDEGRAPWSRRGVTELSMEAAERRLLPIRAATTPLLVHRSALQLAPGPRPGLPLSGALLEWTARTLRTATGYLVPDSVHLAGREARPPSREARTATALMLGGGLSKLERIKLAGGAGCGLTRPALLAGRPRAFAGSLR